ncbi:MAG: hypothetical protein MUO76_09680, partial [Anaerolineaceae bacterium]|nr:hypothetical protein [Anaerolineaceae bacterium]
MTVFGSEGSFQDLELHELNPEKGIVNIGSHPDNDIVVQDPRVMPFHMMLDYRQKPYRIFALNPNADITIAGGSLPGGEAGEVMDLSQVQFGGYSLVVKQNGDGTGAVESLAVVRAGFTPQAGPAIPYMPAVRSPGLPAATQVPDAVRSDIPFRSDDIILVEAGEAQNTIDVEQTASYPVTIINGGPIVATFNVAVEGVPEEWLSIQPQIFNLNEGGRTTVEIRISPPRASSSSAKEYPLTVKVTSPNYPGHYGALSAGLTINPFYEFSVGNLSPRASSASWRKNFAMVGFPITNQGNSPAQYLVSAQDEENGCKFEYKLGDEADQVKQADIKVEAGETTNIPISITPSKRSLVRMRGKNYYYSVATQSMSDPAGSRTISGTFVSRPLFGMLSVILIALMLVIGGYFLVRPRIIDFSVAEDVIELGDPAILSWKVTPFTTNLRIDGVMDEISGSQNEIEVFPTESVATYTLVGGNWLSRMLRMDDVRSTRLTVLVIPPSPVISTFFVDQTEIFEGDDITMKWSVRDADEVFLTVDGVMNTLTPEEFNGERTVTLRNDSLVILEAKNTSGSVIRSEYVHTQKPSIVINEFTLSKTQIIKGEEVTISWDVSGVGVESVMIAPFKDALPLKDKLTFFPEESMEFVLTVKARDLEEIRLLPVGVLPPGAEPEPPSVEFFKAAPEELTAKGNVEFSWSVSGAFTKIEITSPDGVAAGALPAQGFKAVEVGKTTNFVLTAYNNDLSSASILEVKVSNKKDVFIEINKIVPSGTIQRGESVIVYFTLLAVKDGVPVEPITVDWPELE